MEIDKDKIHVSFEDEKKGFIKKTNLAKLKSEQNTERFAVKEKIDAKVIKKPNKDGLYELSVKDLEIEEEKEAMKEYGSSSSGASIGDIIGAALEEDKNKDSEKTKDEKNDSLVKYFLERKSLIKKSFILIIISFFFYSSYKQ